MPQCQKCSELFPNRLVIEGKSRVVNKRKLCLNCSPFNKHNTRSAYKSVYKYCPHCKQNLLISDFYKTRKRGDPNPYCIKCTSAWGKERSRRFKAEYVAYKGGKCVFCGYNKCIAALEFHHTDPTQKDLEIFKRKNKVLNSEVKKELDNCILVCANCHREQHYIRSTRESNSAA